MHQRLVRSRRMWGTALLAASLVLAAQHFLTAQTRNFLWKASNKQGTVYLVGSVHLLAKEYYPLSPAFETAFTESDLLVEEVDLGEMLAPESQMALLTRGLLPAGQ